MRCRLPWSFIVAACAVGCARGEQALADHDAWGDMEVGLARVQTLQRSIRTAPPSPRASGESPVLHLSYERPFRLRLQYDRRLLVADGTNLYVQQGVGNLVRYALTPFTNTLDHLPPTLFLDVRRMFPDLHRLLQPDNAPAPHAWQAFAITLRPDETVGGALCRHVVLTPTSPPTPVAPPIELWFDRSCGVIRRIASNTADYVAINSPLPAGTFGFAPPPDARRMEDPERLLLAAHPTGNDSLTPHEQAALAEESAAEPHAPPAARAFPYLSKAIATRAWSLPANDLLRPAAPHDETIVRIPPATCTVWSGGRLAVLDATSGETLLTVPTPPSWSSDPNPNDTPMGFFLREGTQGVAIVLRRNDDAPPAGRFAAAPQTVRPLTALNPQGHILWTTNLLPGETRRIDILTGVDGRDALLLVDYQRLRVLNAAGHTLLDQPVPQTDHLLISRHGPDGPYAITTLGNPKSRLVWPAPAGGEHTP